MLAAGLGFLALDSALGAAWVWSGSGGGFGDAAGGRDSTCFAAGTSSGLAGGAGIADGGAVSCSRCAAKPTCAAGGALRATTGRSNTRPGGLSPRAAPRTLFSVGATGATLATAALASSSRETRTDDPDTGYDCTNALVGTATTAPRTCRLA